MNKRFFIKFSDKNFLRVHFVYDQEKDKQIFKKMRNDVYYDAIEIGNGKFIERQSKIKNINNNQDYKENALLITYKIVHYIHIFSGFKINRMIVEFMQDEYKNLWLFNCSFISYEKIDGIKDIESIYLRKMSRFIPEKVYDFRKRSQTVPMKSNTEDLREKNSPKMVMFRGLSIEEEVYENSAKKKHKSKEISEFESKVILKNQFKTKEKGSIHLNNNIYDEKNINKKLIINKIRANNFYYKKGSTNSKKKNFKSIDSYLVKTERVPKNKSSKSLPFQKKKNLYYYGRFIKSIKDFEQEIMNTSILLKKNRENTLPYLFYNSEIHSNTKVL